MSQNSNRLDSNADSGSGAHVSARQSGAGGAAGDLDGALPPSTLSIEDDIRRQLAADLEPGRRRVREAESTPSRPQPSYPRSTPVEDDETTQQVFREDLDGGGTDSQPPKSFRFKRRRSRGPRPKNTMLGSAGALVRTAEERAGRAAGDEPPPSSQRKTRRKLSWDGARRCPSCDTNYSGNVSFCPFDGEALIPDPTWDPTRDPLVGRIVADRYEVMNVLAEGGMGTVYKVRHRALGSVFAMKVLRRDLASDKDVASRLVDEARATAAIGHPNIVAVTDFGEIGSDLLPELGQQTLPYFVMELVAGESLAERIQREGALPPVRVASIMLQAASALAAAHGAGIIHRDLKPDNIRLARGDVGEEVPKVLDFGVAKILGSSRKTQTGTVFGTPHYMSPEQGQGQTVDHRSDIYALGVLMYECLTGRVPFESDSYMGVVTKHMFARPQHLAEIDPALTGVPLERIMLRCLEKSPGDRYETTADLVADLERVLEGEEIARYERARLKLRDSVPASAALESEDDGRTRRRLWGVAAVGAVLVAVMVIWSLRARPAAPAPALASPGGASERVTAPLAPVPSARAVRATVPPPAAPSASGAGSVSAGATPPGDGVAPRPHTWPSPKPPPSAGASSSSPPPPPPDKPPPGGDVVNPWQQP